MHQQQVGIFAGHVLRVPRGKVIEENYTIPQVLFNSGGAGYILDDSAMFALISYIDEDVCSPGTVASYEDLLISACLQQSPARIFPMHTKDEYNRNRFFPLTPAYHYYYIYPPDIYSTSHKTDWYYAYHDSVLNPIQALGSHCCSSSTVSYHYIKSTDDMRDLYDYVYTC